jgi:pilus assembly protein CpaB
MNTQRLIVLGLALVAAGGAALLVRSMLGGGTPKVEARTPAVPMSEVLVASSALAPGQQLSADQVRWEKWPTASVDSSFITHQSAGSEQAAVKGTVVRTPIIAGQPITNSALVHGDASGFMAAMLTPGMRAVSITIGTDAGAGGFVLPNDRVDVLFTKKFSGSDSPVASVIIISDVRVLAVDQIYKQEKDTKAVTAKSATLELTPEQSEMISRAQMSGTLSLALRPLGDQGEVATLEDKLKDAKSNSGDVSVIRYGMSLNGGKLALQEKP